MESASAHLSTPGRPLGNLPLELTSFIGREREVAAVEGLLGDRRLVTLCGPGGAGKTRLALAVAQELVEEFDDGVWWVDLAPLSDPRLVARAVAVALGVPESQDTSSTEDLVEHLKPRETLVILDNCEHLVEACADLADRLLRTCPDLEVLATSREPLRVSGEYGWQVPSLSLPDPGRLPELGELEGFEAIHLFVERAQSVDAGFRLTEQNAPAVARLCQKLDGIPLAIELAAARSRVLTAGQILEKLEDPLALLTTGDRSAAPRQRTLRATLEWSYDLLSEDERALFRRLSVFVGGWGLEAAEAVGAGEPVEAGLVLDLLSALLDKSLVVAEENEEEGSSLRYRMLVPVRQFGREKLAESTEAQDTPRRHAEYFLDLAEKADPKLVGPEQARWLQRLRTELGNLRWALEWSLEPDQEERAELRLRLVAALGRFWGREGFEEGKWGLQVALERDPGGFPVARAKALGELGFILLFQQNYAPAMAALEESVAIYKELGDETGAAYALANLGQAAVHGCFRERLPSFEREGAELLEGDLADHPRAYLLVILGMAAQGEGDLDRAASRLAEGLALCRELGSLREAAMAHFILGNVEIDREHLDRGATLLLEGARITRELGDQLGTAYYVWGLGRVAVLRKDPERAARLWGAAESLRDHMGMTLSPFDLAQSRYERDLASVRSALGDASFDAAWSEGRTMSPEKASDYVLQETTTPFREIPADRTSPTVATSESPAEAGGTDLRNNLPVARSGFVGREREMSEVKRALASTRLLTLTGAGGSGKTRLALEVARDLADAYPDGVWLVELASLTEGDLVPGAVAAVLGLREQPDLPFTEALTDFLRSRRILLILDNCEHLVEDCARFVDTLLSMCKHLRVMATSREPLGVAGEVNWMVPSLTVPDEGQPPDPRNLGRYEAVRLFVERARARSPGFVLTRRNAEAVAGICRRLDGIPLAVELATARMGTLSVAQIAERLGDALGFLTTGERTRPPRQRTLRATLAWGHELLSGPEQELFGRLSVFAGGWTLGAAEQVGAGRDAEGGEVLDLLSSLVDKSLVVAEVFEDGAPRYRLLETVRQYASEKLAASGEEEGVRQRHGLFFLGLAERAEPELSAAEQVAWLDRLEGELGNLRAALGWFRGSGQGSAQVRLAGSLWRFCYLRGNYEEGRRWLEGALRAEDGPPSAALAKAYLGAGALTFLQCAYDRARDRLREALALYRVLEDDPGVASASQMLGSIARERGEYARSEALHEESLALYRGLGDEVGEAQSLNYLAYVSWLQGKHERARELCEQTLARFRGLGDNEIVVWALISQGAAALYAGDHRRGRALLEESRALSEEVGYKEGVAWSLNLLGVLAHRESDHRWATDLLRESLKIHQDLGDRWRSASVLEALGEVQCAQGRLGSAACLFGAARAVREDISAPVPLCERADHEAGISATRAELGEAAFEAAFSKGRTMHPQKAAEYAPQEPAPPKAKIPAGRPKADVQLPAPRADSLRIFALGPARVEKEGMLLDSPDWIQKSRELLYYLLSHPEGRTKEQIGLALWPEASTAQLRSSFHDTVFRLRRALGGKEWVVFEKRRYTFGRSLSYSYDVEAFEKNLSEARRLQSEAPDRAIWHLQEAAGLYYGDFLEDIAQSEWTLERQDELRRAYGESLLLLGGLLLAQGRHVEAAEAYRKAISHDRYREEAHRGLMRSQAALGEPGGALRHYEELAKMLQEQLGASPAPETLALYESLRSRE